MNKFSGEIIQVLLYWYLAEITLYLWSRLIYPPLPQIRSFDRKSLSVFLKKKSATIPGFVSTLKLKSTFFALQNIFDNILIYLKRSSKPQNVFVLEDSSVKKTWKIGFQKRSCSGCKHQAAFIWKLWKSASFGQSSVSKFRQVSSSFAKKVVTLLGS